MFSIIYLGFFLLILGFLGHHILQRLDDHNHKIITLANIVTSLSQDFQRTLATSEKQHGIHIENIETDGCLENIYSKSTSQIEVSEDGSDYDDADADYETNDHNLSSIYSNGNVHCMSFSDSGILNFTNEQNSQCDIEALKLFSILANNITRETNVGNTHNIVELHEDKDITEIRHFADIDDVQPSKESKHEDEEEEGEVGEETKGRKKKENVQETNEQPQIIQTHQNLEKMTMDQLKNILKRNLLLSLI
jgi:hypothetical protein